MLKKSILSWMVVCTYLLSAAPDVHGNPFEILPDETICHVLILLPLADLANVSRATSRLRRIANSELVVKEVCKRHGIEKDVPAQSLLLSLVADTLFRRGQHSIAEGKYEQGWKEMVRAARAGNHSAKETLGTILQLKDPVALELFPSIIPDVSDEFKEFINSQIHTFKLTSGNENVDTVFQWTLKESSVTDSEYDQCCKLLSSLDKSKFPEVDYLETHLRWRAGKSSDTQYDSDMNRVTEKSPYKYGDDSASSLLQYLHAITLFSGYNDCILDYEFGGHVHYGPGLSLGILTALRGNYGYNEHVESSYRTGGKAERRESVRNSFLRGVEDYCYVSPYKALDDDQWYYVALLDCSSDIRQRSRAILTTLMCYQKQKLASRAKQVLKGMIDGAYGECSSRALMYACYKLHKLSNDQSSITKLNALLDEAPHFSGYYWRGILLFKMDRRVEAWESFQLGLEDYSIRYDAFKLYYPDFLTSGENIPVGLLAKVANLSEQGIEGYLEPYPDRAAFYYYQAHKVSPHAIIGTQRITALEGLQGLANSGNASAQNYLDLPDIDDPIRYEEDEYYDSSDDE